MTGGGRARAGAAVLAVGVLAGAAAVSWAYFSETKTNPQPISVAFPANIKYESTSTPSIADAATIPVAVPPGVQPGWLLVATIAGESTPVVTPPSGWTAVAPPLLHASGRISLRSFWRFAIAGEPASHTFTLSTKKRTSAAMLAYSGVKAPNPIEATANATGKSLVATAARATALYPTRWIATTAFDDKAALTFSADVTQRWQLPTAGTENVAVAEGAMPAGMNPAATVTSTTTHEWVIQSILLNAAP